MSRHSDSRRADMKAGAQMERVACVEGSDGAVSHE